MMNNQYSQYIKKYQSMDLEIKGANSSEYELVCLFLEGTISLINKAIGHAKRSEISLKGENINKALAVVEGIKGSIKDEPNSKELYNLFCNISYLLQKANVKSDPRLLESANNFLTQILNKWKDEHKAQVVSS